MLLHTTSYARAGLLGNPSDGYYGKTISFTMRDFKATVTLYESPRVQLIPAAGVDDAVFDDLDALVQDVQLFGYYGGIRLLKAVIKIFRHYCEKHGIRLPKRNFTVEYRSNIPRLVGMAGSSAICTAMFKSLLKFYEVDCQKELIPTLCWRAERDELGIQCGLQDRVVQVYNGLVYMDFDRKLFDANDHGAYVPLAASILPNLFMAYDPRRAEISGVYHKRLRVLFEEGEADIIAAMSEFADIARQGYEALINSDTTKLPELINANFDLRDRIFNVAEENRRMVLQAREAGASAKFAGSGGAIVGTYEDQAMLTELRRTLKEIGCEVLTPGIVPGDGNL